MGSAGEGGRSEIVQVRSQQKNREKTQNKEICYVQGVMYTQEQQLNLQELLMHDFLITSSITELAVDSSYAFECGVNNLINIL